MFQTPGHTDGPSSTLWEQKKVQSYDCVKEMERRVLARMLVRNETKAGEATRKHYVHI